MISTIGLRIDTKPGPVERPGPTRRGFVTAAAVLLAGCAAPAVTDKPSAKPTSVSKADFDKAMSTPTTIEYWSWLEEVPQMVALFEKKYPDITLNLSNVGAGTVQFTKVRTALQAGNAPDVMHCDYQNIATFARDLLDLTAYGASDYAADYSPSAWGQMKSGDRVLGVPIDLAPMAAMYRSDLLAKAGVGVPVTYDDFATAAKAVKDKTGAYLATLPSNAATYMLAILQAAGVKPFTYDGATKVGIKLNGADAKDVMRYWNTLVQAGLISGDPNFTDAWYRGFATNTYASWFPAPWGPRRLQGTAANTTGLWTLAKVPQFKKGVNTSSLWGGSATSVLKTSKHPIVAAEWARFLSQDPDSVKLLMGVQQQMPALKAANASPAFIDAPNPFFKDQQQTNKLFVEIAGTVDPNYAWLPFMGVVGTTYNDTLGKALAEKTDLVTALDAWQKAVVDYATQQGFTVS